MVCLLAYLPLPQVQTNTYGTITHQPPETLADGCVSRETDIFSFGVLLWQM
jgi:mitogen-activated protein kinase kinase kinase 11